MKIDGHVSDLFFNLDHDDARIMEAGHFVGFDNDKMLEQADWFARSIEHIGGPAYQPADIVEDFYDRV